MNTSTLAVALPVSATTLGLADDRWERWVEKGRVSDLLMRERWLRLASTAAIAMVLTAAVVIGLL
jgi:hypothetical protein